MEEKKIVVEVRNPYLDARAAQTQSEVNNTITFVMLLIAGSFFYWLYNLILSWNSFSAPYKYILAFYYYIFIVPFHTVPDVWNWMMHIDITPYPHLNFIFGLIGMILFLLLALIVFGMFCFFVYEKLHITWNRAFAILLTPGFIGIIWYVISGIFGWLFMKG